MSGPLRTRNGTCDGCRKRRKLTHPANDLKASASDAVHYYGLCSECFPKVKTQEDIRTLREAARLDRKANPKPKYRKAYVCIGGLLDGEFACTTDFYTGGMYEHLSCEYAEYNSAGRFHGGDSSMIFVHTALIKAPITGRKR